MCSICGWEGELNTNDLIGTDAAYKMAVASAEILPLLLSNQLKKRAPVWYDGGRLIDLIERPP